ncbi:MAG: hypothetical protein HQL28_06825, partial [Candidatus Omnitrophica bacterium]|nr:hypothetical protein [Candidatus Omnitrophota bacterium]
GSKTLILSTDGLECHGDIGAEDIIKLLLIREDFSPDIAGERFLIGDLCNGGHDNVELAERMGALKDLAREAGIGIPTNAKQRKYTLIVDKTLFNDWKELEYDKLGYDIPGVGHVGTLERFNLVSVDTSNVENILDAVSDPGNTIVQVAGDMNEIDIEKLEAALPKIRVMRVDTNFFGQRSAEERRDMRFDIYAMMLVARHITEQDITENTSDYRMLKFLLDTHKTSERSSTSEVYISSLVRSQLFLLIKHNISYVPAERWNRPEYHLIAATLMSA